MNELRKFNPLSLEYCYVFIFGSSLFCVDIPIKTNGGLELKIVLSIKNDEEP